MGASATAPRFCCVSFKYIKTNKQINWQEKKNHKFLELGKGVTSWPSLPCTWKVTVYDLAEDKTVYTTLWISTFRDFYFPSRIKKYFIQ